MPHFMRLAKASSTRRVRFKAFFSHSEMKVTIIKPSCLCFLENASYWLHNDALFDAHVISMRTTINIDDELYQQAVQLTGKNEKTALVREALQALIEKESAKRLAKLGGSEPHLKSISRRRAVGE